MPSNPLDHSNVLDINLTIHAELADKFYEAANLGGYKNKRLTQLQVLLANLISNHQTDPDLYTSVSLADGFYKPTSRYNSYSIGKGFINLIRELAEDLQGLTDALRDLGIRDIVATLNRLPKNFVGLGKLQAAMLEVLSRLAIKKLKVIEHKEKQQALQYVGLWRIKLPPKPQ